MTPERWRQVTGVFHAAVARDTAARDYRVALAGDGSVDRLATAQLRAMAAE